MNKSIASLLARFTAKTFSSADAQLKLYFWMIENTAGMLGKFVQVSEADMAAVQSAKQQWEAGNLSDAEKQELAGKLKSIVDEFEGTVMTGLKDCIQKNPEADIRELVSEDEPEEDPEEDEEPEEEPEQPQQIDIMSLIIKLTNM